MQHPPSAHNKTPVKNNDIFDALFVENLRHQSSKATTLNNSNKSTAPNNTQASKINEYRKPITHQQYKSTLLQMALMADQYKNKTIATEQSDVVYALQNDLFRKLSNQNNTHNYTSIKNYMFLMKQRCSKFSDDKRLELQVGLDDLLKTNAQFQTLFQKRAIPSSIKQQSSSTLPSISLPTLDLNLTMNNNNSNTSTSKNTNDNNNNSNGSSSISSRSFTKIKQTRSIEVQTDPIPSPASPPPNSSHYPHHHDNKSFNDGSFNNNRNPVPSNHNHRSSSNPYNNKNNNSHNNNNRRNFSTGEGSHDHHVNYDDRHNDYNDNDYDDDDDDVEMIDEKPNPFKTANQLIRTGDNNQNNNNNNRQQQQQNGRQQQQQQQQQNGSSRTAPRQVEFKANPVLAGINKAKEMANQNSNNNSGANGGKKRKFTAPRTVADMEKETANGGPNAKKQKTNGSSGAASSDGASNRAFALFPNGEIPEELSHLDAKLVESICHDILMTDAGVAWDDIAGLQGPKRTIYEIVIWPMKRPDLFHGIRGPPKGVLLFGPPGTGKTLIAKAVATESRSTFFSISASSITSKWIGEGERLVRTLFSIARYLQPSVIFIDEIDSLLSARSDSDEDNGTKRIKTEFLVQLDGATTNGSDRLLVLGATNLPQTIDEAVRRRLVKRIYIPLPDRAARLSLLQRTLGKSKISYDISDQDFEKILDWTEGYSGSDLSAYVTDAAMGPVREISPRMIERVSVGDVRPVQLKDFRKARNNIRASVNPTEVNRYEQWDSEFGCRYTEDDDNEDDEDVDDNQHNSKDNIDA